MAKAEQVVVLRPGAEGTKSGRCYEGCAGTVVDLAKSKFEVGKSGSAQFDGTNS